MGINRIRQLAKEKSIIYDLKHMFPKEGDRPTIIKNEYTDNVCKWICRIKFNKPI